MAALTLLELPQAPPEQAIHLALYRNVTEAGALLEKLASGKFEFALIDTRSILSKAHLAAAIFRAVNDQANGRMKTRNVHSEIVLALNVSNNIAEAYKKFGISKDTKSLLVVKIGATDEKDIAQQLDQAIQGERVEATDENIASQVDLELIRKVYKLGSQPNESTRRKERKEPATTMQSDLQHSDDLETAVIELIALRGAS